MRILEVKKSPRERRRGRTFDLRAAAESIWLRSLSEARKEKIRYGEILASDYRNRITGAAKTDRAEREKKETRARLVLTIAKKGWFVESWVT